MADNEELRRWIREIYDSNKGYSFGKGLVAQTFFDATLVISVWDPFEIFEAGKAFREVATADIDFDGEEMRSHLRHEEWPSHLRLICSLLSQFCLWDDYPRNA